MTFGANASTKYTTMVVNYTAQSLYSVMNESFTKTWPVSASTITTPPGINKNCLVRGLNMQRSSPWMIKTRIGIQSTKRLCTCPELPYLMRGVGIGLSKRPKRVVVISSLAVTIIHHPDILHTFFQLFAKSTFSNCNS